MTTEQRLSRELHRGGLRSTRLRRCLLRLVETAPRPLSRNELLEKLDPPPNRVTLYRALRDLTASGLLEAVTTPEGTRYGRSRHPHAHFTCTVCGRALCLPGVEPPSVDAPAGFQLERVELNLHGVCPGCAKNQDDR